MMRHRRYIEMFDSLQKKTNKQLLVYSYCIIYENKTGTIRDFSFVHLKDMLLQNKKSQKVI
jgi:hypothetical protein